MVCSNGGTAVRTTQTPSALSLAGPFTPYPRRGYGVWVVRTADCFATLPPSGVMGLALAKRALYPHRFAYRTPKKWYAIQGLLHFLSACCTALPPLPPYRG